jgi:hypothetical protein
MSERDVAELRKRIDVERTRLDEHLTVLEGELLSGKPLLAAGVVAGAALLLRRRGKKKPRALTITWKLGN